MENFHFYSILWYYTVDAIAKEECEGEGLSNKKNLLLHQNIITPFSKAFRNDSLVQKNNSTFNCIHSHLPLSSSHFQAVVIFMWHQREIHFNFEVCVLLFATQYPSRTEDQRKKAISILFTYQRKTQNRAEIINLIEII